MKKMLREKYLCYGAALLFCVFLTVGLLSILVDTPTTERKRAHPGGAIEEEEQEKESDVIRVVIKTNGFKQVEHAKVVLRAESGLVIRNGKETKECKPGEEITIGADHGMFQDSELIVEPKVENEKITIASLKRGYGIPSYRGKLNLYAASKGVVIVNELSMEEYLYAVVPSEMPASYELEALKAQAVCARSYAAKQTRNYSYPQYEAHVDDSTEYQVYGNSKEQEKAIQAVNETAGEKVWHGNEVATTYYFSTSCGKTTTAEAWGSKPSNANAYLKSIPVEEKEGCAYEKQLPWYKWSARVDEKVLSNLIAKNTKTKIGNLNNIEITKRGPGGVALQMVAKGDKGTATVDTENRIRRALGGTGYVIERRDGKKVKSSELLPSAFFTIEKKGSEYIIKGGGYGHGIGMSQNGANEIAKKGKSYQEILKLFYNGIEIRK